MEYKHKYDETFYSYIEKGSISSAEKIVPIMMEHLEFSSVVDIGCGRGAWLSIFKKNKIQKVLGLDGAYVSVDNLLVERSEFLSHNLSTKLEMNDKFDLVMSLEVAEHIAEEYADIFVRNLVNLGDVVLFSAAVVGQGGEYHVNEQPSLYWKEKFEAQGYSCYDFVRKEIVNHKQVMPWYRYNTFIYANEAGVSRLSSKVLANLVPKGQRAPEMYSLTWRIRLMLIKALPSWLSTYLAELNSKLEVLKSHISVNN